MRQGEHAALEQLYMSYYNRLIGYGLKYCPDRNLLKDSINNTFLYIWEKRASLSEANHVGNYIFRSFQRQLEKDLKKSQGFEALGGDESLYCESDEMTLIQDQDERIRVRTLKEAILKLPKRQRELILLRYYEGLSYDQISEKTGLSKRTVYNHIHTAIGSLKSNANLQNLKHILSMLAFF